MFDLGFFIASWTAMMTAMMLPSAVPTILLYRLGARRRRLTRTALFLVGYLLVWSAVGVPAWASQSLVAALPTAVAPVVASATLLIAGAYQFTPLKAMCLRACRTPMDFLLTHWYEGELGAVRLGLEHGWYCLGCCWGLVAVLVVVGAMSLAWAAVLACVVFVEKVVPGARFARPAIGVALVALAILVAARPEVATLLAPGL